MCHRRGCSFNFATNVFYCIHVVIVYPGRINVFCCIHVVMVYIYVLPDRINVFWCIHVVIVYIYVLPDRINVFCCIHVVIVNIYVLPDRINVLCCIHVVIVYFYVLPDSINVFYYIHVVIDYIYTLPGRLATCCLLESYVVTVNVLFYQAVPPPRDPLSTGIWNRASTTITPRAAVMGSVVITHRYGLFQYIIDYDNFAYFSPYKSVCNVCKIDLISSRPNELRFI